MSGTQANIIDCHLDGRGMKTPLITAEGASIKISCSEFDNFKSMEGASILHGKYGTEVSIENSSFHGNQALYGIVFLHDNCSINMSFVHVYLFKSYQYGLSAFIFWKNVTCLIEDCEFIENQGFLGSAMAGIDNTVIKSINNTFIGNQGVLGGATGIVGNSSLEAFNNTFMRNKAEPINELMEDGDLFENSYLRLFSVIRKDEIFEHPDLYRRISFGGAIVAKWGSNITFNSSNFIENKAFLGGAVFANGSIQMEVFQCDFQENVAQFTGGSILGVKNTSIIIRHSSFTENRAVEGGSLFMGIQSSGFVLNSSFSRNVAQGNGGAMRVGGNSSLDITECWFDNNKADLKGGAIFAHGSTYLEVTYSTFIKNSAMDGGVLCLKDNSTLNIDSCNFSRNAGIKLGGVFYLSDIVRGSVKRSHFFDNRAEGGGAIEGMSVHCFEIYNNTFQGNIADEGGAVEIICDSEIKVNKSYFVSNTASNLGGAINTLKSVTGNFEKNYFKDNVAGISGGAMSATNKANIIVLKSYFENNSAPLGGAILILSQSNLHVDECIFRQNMATTNLLCNENTNLRIKNAIFYEIENLASGGALLCVDSFVITIENSFFVNNSAYEGGSIHGKGNNFTANITNSIFKDNKANISSVLYLEKTVSINLRTIEFINNVAPISSVVFMLGASIFNISDCLFINNTSGIGGALTISHSGIGVILSCQFKNNTVTNELVDIALEIGREDSVDDQYCNSEIRTLCATSGALHLHSTHSVQIERSVFSENHGDAWRGGGGVGGAGGAVLISVDVLFNIERCEFRNNTSNKSGGAIVFFANVTGRISDSNFINNSAHTGAAVYESSVINLSVYNSNFTDNEAESRAGAIFCKDQCSINFKNSTLNGNVVLNGGGGALNVQINGTIHIHGCQFLNNTADGLGGAVVFYDEVEGFVQDSKFEGNKGRSGGAIGVSMGCKLRLETCYFRHNYASIGGALCGINRNIFEIENSTYTANSAHNGGSVAIENHGTMEVTNSRFENNRADVDGGAIMLHEQVNATISNILFYNNSAGQG